jgi:hypothetical protein
VIFGRHHFGDAAFGELPLNERESRGGAAFKGGT